MKTEKRLTMALSVLVALMMLAVPLASSSNLFVDGGQTNSNGDAPLIGDNVSPRVDFILNESDSGRISLDTVNINALVEKLNETEDDNTTWYEGENGNIFAIVKNTDDVGVTVQYLIYLLTTAVDTQSHNLVSKPGYDLDSWKGDSATYSPISTDPGETGDKITKDMTITAQWVLDKEKYAEIPVDVVVDGEVFGEYVKVYPKFEGEYSDKTVIDEKNVYVSAAGTFIATGVSDVNTFGIVVNDNSKGDIAPLAVKIYTFKTTYGEDKEIKTDASDLKIPVNSKLTSTYSFDSKTFSKITVSSSAFADGKDVTLFADNNRTYSYKNVYDALKLPDKQHNIDAAITLDKNGVDKDKNPITDNGYKLTGWNNGAALIESELTASSPLTLDAELNGYYAIFMSKGQFEYVYVPFGELSADLVKSLDLNGVNHWAWMKYTDYKGISAESTFKTFGSFTDSLVDEVDGSVNKKTYDGKEPVAVFVACFESTNNTAYAVFNGDSANFGNEYVTKLIIPGKVGAKIVEPSLVPAYNQEESRTLFMGWDKTAAEPSEGGGDGEDEPDEGDVQSLSAPEDEENVYGAKNTVVFYDADPQPYKYTITFYDGSNVVGVFYYYENTPNSDKGIKNGLVAFEYDGKVYAIGDLISKDETIEKAAAKAYSNIYFTTKDGYEIKQWNDADKNAMIAFTKEETADNKTKIVDKVNIKDMKDDLNLYAQFEPKDYLIIYYANTATASNTMVQVGTVDEGLALFGESTFGNEGYVLKEWNTRPDGKGTSYALGSDFTLNGSGYKDASKTPTGVDGVPTGYDKCVTLYAIWEKVGGNGSGSGDNNEGNNDSNTDTYLLAGILIVIIVLIIVVAVVLRKKQ